MLNFLLKYFNKDKQSKVKQLDPVPPLVQLGPEKVETKHAAAVKKSGRPKKNKTT